MNEALDTLFGRDIDWLFWPPLRPRPDSAWLGHIPFAHWIIGATRPRLFVELGTFSGASYAAFCDAVLRFGTASKCYAVDTWVGDSHAGNYGEAIYNDLTSFNAARFASFSTLLRMTFDQAAGQFADGTIDLLHIDGFHTYEAMRHDFENWLPKLSDRAIVLFHDVAERKADFGVWKYWAELRQTYAGFEFEHAHGLGVLQVGAAYDGPALPLLKTNDAQEIATIRSRFAALGQNAHMVAYAAKMHLEAEQLKQMLRQQVRRP